MYVNKYVLKQDFEIIWREQNCRKDLNLNSGVATAQGRRGIWLFIFTDREYAIDIKNLYTTWVQVQDVITVMSFLCVNFWGIPFC